MHLLEWWKLKIFLTVLSADEDAEQLQFSYVAGENAKWYSCFKKQPNVSCKVKPNTI